MITPATAWVMLMRGSAYQLKDHGLTFEYQVPKEVPYSLAVTLCESGSFVVCKPDGTIPEIKVASETPPVKFIPPPPVFSSGTLIDLPEPSSLTQKQPRNLIGPNDDLNEKNVLLRRYGGIGDVVFVAQVAAEIKRRWPKSIITLGVHPDHIQFASMFDAVDLAIDVDHSCTYDVVRTQDFIIPFHNVIERDHTYTRDFYDAHWERTGLGARAPEELPLLAVNRIGLSASLQKQAQDFLNSMGVGLEQYVVVCVGTTNPLKRYPIDSFKEVAEALTRNSAERVGTHVICLGNYRQTLDRTFKASPETSPRITWAMDLPLGVSAELVRRARCVIGADTGLVQFASAIGVPTVSLWGPINPKFSIEHNTTTKQVILSEPSSCNMLPCSTLRLARCPYYKSNGTACMKAIEPKRVIEAVASLQLHDAFHPADVLDTTDLVSSITSTVVKGVPHDTLIKTRVAVLIDNAHMHSGGGHYLFRNAVVMSNDPELDVTVFTDSQQSVYEPTTPHNVTLALGAIKHANGAYTSVDGLDDSFDVVLAGPPHLGTLAMKWKTEVNNNGVVILAAYETPAFIAKHREGLDTSEEFWAEYKEALLACDYVWCISKPVRDEIREWDERFADKTKVTLDIVAPCVNSNMASLVIGDTDLFNPDQRDNSVVIVGRNMPYKRMGEATALTQKALAELYATTGNTYTISLIGDSVGLLRGKITPVQGVSIEYLENVTEYDKWYKIRRAKCVLHPSDLEGFGIVIAEAMYAVTPVIVQSLPEYTDSFATFPFPYRTDEEMLETLATVIGSWEKDAPGHEKLREYVLDARAFVSQRYIESGLSRRLRRVFQLRKKLVAAKQRAAERATAKRIETASQRLRVAVVCTWGTQCGIAETTRHVVDHFNCAYKIFAAHEPELAKTKHAGDARVHRCWDRNFDSTRELRDALIAFQPHIVHMHHEFSFYRNTEKFFNFIADLRGLGIKVVVTPHTYLPASFFDRLQQSVDCVVYTKPHEGLRENERVVDLPVASIVRPTQADARQRLNLQRSGFFVGSLGMWVPHKGYAELLSTQDDVSLMCGDNVRYLIAGYANPRTPYMSQIYDAHKARFESGRAIRRCDFIDDDAFNVHGCACDVLVYNYNVTAHFSASAAIRSGMACGRPIICTHSPMFSEFEDGTHVLKVPFGDLQVLTSAITRLYADTNLRNTLVRNCDEYIADCTPVRTAQKMQEVYMGLVEH